MKNINKSIDKEEYKMGLPNSEVFHSSDFIEEYDASLRILKERNKMIEKLILSEFYRQAKKAAEDTQKFFYFYTSTAVWNSFVKMIKMNLYEQKRGMRDETKLFMKSDSYLKIKANIIDEIKYMGYTVESEDDLVLKISVEGIEGNLQKEEEQI